MRGCREEHRVLVLAPTGADARTTRRVLESAGIPVTTAPDMEHLCSAIASGAGALLLTDQSLKLEGSLKSLAAALDCQPKWSDLHTVLLCSGGANATIAMEALNVLHNLLVLDRPVHLPNLLSAVKTALRSRERQYQIREHLSERERSENALRESEEQFRAFFESAAVGAAQLGLDGRFLKVNDRLCRITGFSRDELLSMTPDDLTHPAEREQARTDLSSYLKGQAGEYHAKKQYIRKDGEVLWVEVSAALVRDSAGRPLRSAGILQDITERKRMEDSLREDDRRKNEFLAMLGHELRNPLAAITAGLRLLRTQDTGNHSWVKESLERQTRQLITLVDDLLDISRITQGKIQLRPEIVDLRTVAKSAGEAAADLIADKKHAFSVSIPEAPLPVLGDPTRLQQIIANLVNNAAKYTPEGGRIELLLHGLGNEAVIRVKDNGLGIPIDMQVSIFDLFGQVESAVHRPQQGLGIGLNLVKMLVSLHGGTVAVESDGMGKGSVFTVRLPAAPQREVKGRAEPSAADEQERLDILLVEDNREAAQMLGALLQERAHKVRVAGSGNEAVRLARGSQPDLVILDIGLPDISGYEVARAIRQELGYQDTLIIAATGYGQESDRQLSREAGIDHHLVKPIEYETIALLAREWRRTAGRLRQAARAAADAEQPA